MIRTIDFLEVENNFHRFQRFEIDYILVSRMKILDILSVILTTADMASDMALALDYWVTNNPWWCELTSAFIVVPTLL